MDEMSTLLVGFKTSSTIEDFDFLGPSTIDLCTSQSLVSFQGPTFWLSNVETVPVVCVNIDLIALLSGVDDVRTTGAEWRSNDV